MITIDLMNDDIAATEKPHTPAHPSRPVSDSPAAAWTLVELHSHHQELIQQAQAARLAQAAQAGDLPVDVQRFAQRWAPLTTLVERYVGRIRELALGG
jgi:hypothetical protein